MTFNAERDAEGKFKSVTLSDEHIQKMQEGRELAKLERESNKKRLLLQQLGFDPDNLDVDIDHLADMFLKGGTNSISSHNKLCQRSPLFKDSPLGYDPESGEPCPLCGGGNNFFEQMSMQELKVWAERMDALIAIEHKAGKSSPDKTDYILPKIAEPPEYEPKEYEDGLSQNYHPERG